jgi:predicted RNA-binding protein associated with RNAse of E/G family
MPSRRPRILEIKRTLDGREKRFDCAVLARTPTHLTVLFVSTEPMDVHGVVLPAGTVTFGHFWTDRPYNVYHWLDPRSGETLGTYVNVADQTTIDDDVLAWRDLVVDVLVAPGRALAVLDEDELPGDLPAELRARISATTATLRASWTELAAELEAARVALWPEVQLDLAPQAPPLSGPA